MSKEDFQPEILEDNERNLEVKRKFTAIFKRDAEFYVRVPGRVNLIGEHIDYSGYGVCPMALKQDIFLAVATTTERTLQLRNTNCRYDSHDCFLNEINVMEGNPPQWYQYFLCGVKGIVETMPPETRLKGLKVMVNGTIPQSAGLSSSSALVCAAALATAFANQWASSRICEQKKQNRKTKQHLESKTFCGGHAGLLNIYDTSTYETFSADFPYDPKIL